MINLHTKCQVSMCTHFEDMKGNAICRIWGDLGVRVTLGRRQCTLQIPDETQYIFYRICVQRLS